MTVPDLAAFFHDYLWEAGRVEAVYGGLAYDLAAVELEANFIQGWLDLNRRLSALKLSRESREASAVLGKRFLQLLAGLEPEKPVLQ